MGWFSSNSQQDDWGDQIEFRSHDRVEDGEMP